MLKTQSTTASKFTTPVTQDQFMIAIDWMDDNLERPLFRFDIDDVSAMAEQLTASPERGFSLSWL